MFQSQNMNPYRYDSTLSHDDHETVKCSSVHETVLTKAVCTRPFFAKHGRVWKMCASSAKFNTNEAYNLYHI
jgi:hypothetical protein